MKRVLLAVTGTIAGLVALLGYKSTGTAIGVSGALPSAGLPHAGGASNPTHGATPSTHHRHARTGSKNPTSSPPSASSGATASGVSHTVTGAAEQTPYGVVQVKVTGTKGKIANVQFVQLTAYDGTSQMINQQAAPILLQQTMQAQSANIHGVSGATYTSMGYIASLQSALDRL